MVAPITVKLQDSQEAVISIGRVEIRDTRGYPPKLITILDIEDAIALAKMILAMEAEPVSADEAWIQRMEAEREARWDAISERA